MDMLLLQAAGSDTMGGHACMGLTQATGDLLQW